MTERDPWDAWRKRRQSSPFGGFFPHDIEAEFERMRQYMERMMADAFRGAGPMPKPGQPFVYGFSLHVGPDGKPQFQEFGNARHASIQSEEGVRTPLADVQKGEKEIAVTVELPGVEKEDINLHVADERITIRVDQGRHKYYKEIPLPTRVVPKSAHATFKNGVLDITVERKDTDSDAGERVPVK